MRNRQKTLGWNLGIYALFPLLLVLHGYFWNVWLTNTRKSLDAKKKQLVELENQVKKDENDTNSFRETVTRTQETLDTRQRELDEMGPFLPSIKEKGDIMEKIQSMIQSLGVRILSMDSPQPDGSGEGGYFALNFSMELMGPYRAFKQLFARVQQTSMIIRIGNFKVEDYGTGNASYDWRIKIQFQTYFGR